MMERISISKNFFLDEYIPEKLYKDTFAKWGPLKAPYILMGLLDARLVRADQALRNRYGFTTINNWWDEGDRNWSGIRIPESPYYSITSQHSYGRASDKIYRDASAEEVREDIKKNYIMLGITCIEEVKDAPADKDINWVHSDVRWHINLPELMIVHP